MKVAALHRFPVKGLSAETLISVELTTGRYFPGDRLFAIENGPSGFDPAEPRWQPKIKYLTLMRQGGLARLRTRYDDAVTTLTVDDGQDTVACDLSTEDGRSRLEAFLARVLSGELRGPPKVLAAPDGFRFTDARIGYVSIINRASVAAVEAMVGRPVDPLRFRGNLLVEGLKPWTEFELLGRTFAGPSGVELTVTDRIDRCAATNVDPGTGERDLDIPRALMRALGHIDCGVYAQVTRSGRLHTGDILWEQPGVQLTAGE